MNRSSGVGEDAIETIERFVLFALLGRQETIDVEREVVSLEPFVVLENAREERTRAVEVGFGRGTALVGRRFSHSWKRVTSCSRSLRRNSQGKRRVARDLVKRSCREPRDPRLS